MSRWLLMAAAACSRTPSADVAPPETLRPSAAPVLSVSVQSGLRTPDPACTCASPESSPAPSKYETECNANAACEEIHYAEYLRRTPRRDALGVLLSTHYVESKIYDATISFPARDGDSTFRVSVGDIVPTPRGRARVVQVHRSFVRDWDDGYVTLHLLEPSRDERAKVFVSSGAPSHVHGVAVTMVQAARGSATIVFADGPTRLDVKKGDAVTMSVGRVRVTDVIDGVKDAALGWVEFDSAAE